MRFIHGRSEFVVGESGHPIRQVGTAHDISERRRTEQNLREREVELVESEEKFSTAFNAAPTPMIITDAKSEELIEVNEAFVQAIGYTREELSNSKTMPEDIWIDEEDEKEMREVFKKCRTRTRGKQRSRSFASGRRKSSS